MAANTYCMDCGEALHGRLDKKFCNDACRNNYNNRLNSDQYSFIRNINNILRKNRRILEKLNPDGKTKISQKKLLAQGLNFDYFTHVYTTQNGHNYRFCYDQGYLLLDNEEILLVKKEEHGKK
jgi:hypothetical protein